MIPNLIKGVKVSEYPLGVCIHWDLLHSKRISNLFLPYISGENGIPSLVYQYPYLGLVVVVVQPKSQYH